MRVAYGDVIVRRADSADLPPILHIAASIPELPDWKPEIFQSMLSSEPGMLTRTVLVGVLSGEVAGFGVMTTLRSVPPPESEIESLAVREQWRHRGAGRAILAALLAESRALGAGSVLLEVRSGNAAAIALYSRSGFQQTGRRQEYYRNPVDDAVLMKARLD